MNKARDPLVLRSFKRHRLALDTRPFRKELAGSQRARSVDERRQIDVVERHVTQPAFLVVADTAHEPGVAIEDVQGCEPTRFGASLPNLMAMLEAFAAERRAVLRRVMVVRLRSRDRVRPHADREKRHVRQSRHCLILDGVCRLSVGSEAASETVVMRQGELWSFDDEAAWWSTDGFDAWCTLVVFDVSSHVATS